MRKMVKPSKSSGSSFTLGRHGFAKISAVEGIRVSRQMDKDFGEFDRKELSAKERREALSGKYGAKR
jgi:hypothetical protein